MSTCRLVDLPLDARELQALLARTKELLKDGGFAWVRDVDMLSHCTPGTSKVDAEGRRCERPVDGYSLAIALPARGLKLTEVGRLAQWFETKVVGCCLACDDEERKAAWGRCHVSRSEVVFGPYTAQDLRRM